MAIEELLDDEAEGLTRKAIELALAGDTTALRLCLERILPPRRDRPVALELPSMEGVKDLGRATAALLEAVAAGEMTPGEAVEIGKLIDALTKLVDLILLSDARH